MPSSDPRSAQAATPATDQTKETPFGLYDGLPPNSDFHRIYTSSIKNDKLSLFPVAKHRGTKFQLANHKMKDTLFVAAEGHAIGLGERASANMKKLLGMRIRNGFELRRDVDKTELVTKVRTLAYLCEAVLGQTAAHKRHEKNNKCTCCADDEDPGGIFAVCRSVKGMYGGSCMNCLVQGTYKQCSFHEAEADAGSEPGDDGDSDAGERPVKRSKTDTSLIYRSSPADANDDGDTVANPISGPSDSSTDTGPRAGGSIQSVENNDRGAHASEDEESEETESQHQPEDEETVQLEEDEGEASDTSADDQKSVEREPEQHAKDERGHGKSQIQDM
ncbi:MAG: hypothetical protein MMC23_001912 [Stictis urceolatum]|nr:hypothetical protein [Stictis urceolata]